MGAGSGTSQEGGPCGAERAARPQKPLMKEEYLTSIRPLENKERPGSSFCWFPEKLSPNFLSFGNSAKNTERSAAVR